MITGAPGRWALTLAVTALLAACTLKPLAEWRDSNFTGTVDNVLIIGVSDEAVVRRMFEDTFVRELAAVGVSAESSYRILTDEQITSEDTLEAAIKAQAMDAVLITRVIGVEEIDTYTPPTYTYTRPAYAYKPPTHDPHYQDYHSYFNHAVRVARPGYWDKYEILKLESNLYDSGSEKLIWSIQSESFDPRSARQVIEDQIAIAIRSLRNTGLIPE